MKPYYEHAGITIYHGDCREILPHVKADVVVTDPPYEAEAHTLQRRKRGKTTAVGERVIDVAPLDFAPMDETFRADVAGLIARCSARWTLTFCQVEAAMLWRFAYEAAGLGYRRTMVWIKPDGMPQLTGDRPGMGYESIVVMHPPGRSVWNGGGRHGVFIQNKSDNGGRPNPHPTMKPSRLMRDLLALFSNDGETVLDPFMGSGTTLVAAKLEGRKAIGIEIEERYCEIAAKRLAQEVLPFTEALR